MPNQRWQDPKIQVRSDVSRPFYFIRPFVPIVTAEGLVRKQKSIPLGFCDEVSKRQAQARKQEIMATVNQGKFVVECQIPFRELARKYLDARAPRLGSATQEKYRLHIENRILPAFGNLRLCDIDQPTVEAWLNAKAQPLGQGKPGLSWWTRMDLKNILSAMFTAAEEWKLWRGENPCARVKIGPQAEVREKRLLSADAFTRLLDILPEPVRFMVMIAFVVGLRTMKQDHLNRITVEEGILGVGATINEILADYPLLEREDISSLPSSTPAIRGSRKGRFHEPD